VLVIPAIYIALRAPREEPAAKQSQ
jgi:hypothetical protein